VDVIRNWVRTHLTVAPQINEGVEVGQGSDVVGDVVDFGGFEGAVAGIPVGTRVGGGFGGTGVVLLLVGWELFGHADGLGFPFVALR
jgi:hypothetical protein